MDWALQLNSRFVGRTCIMTAPLRALVIVAVGIGLAALLVANIAGFMNNKRSAMKTETVHVVITASTVESTTDTFALIEPLWERVDIYNSWAKYEATLKPFSIGQRHLFAIHWYRSEVNNGGHEQFFSNSTGIVCEHAIAALEALGLPEGASILRTASQRLGGASREREARENQLESAGADFEDLDDHFFKLEGTGVLDEKMLAFAREHPSDFLFAGDVERIVLPPPEPSN